MRRRANSEEDGAQVAQHLARNLVALRRARTLTQEALAREADVPRSTIANLESGVGNPSLHVLVKVATALRAPIEELLGSPRAKVRQWRESEIRLEKKGRGVTNRSLVPEPVRDQLLDLMHFAPAAVMGGTPHLPGTREYFTCLEGEVHIVVAGDKYTLKPGEVLAFPGNVPHSYANGLKTKEARGISVVVLAHSGV